MKENSKKTSLIHIGSFIMAIVLFCNLTLGAGATESKGTSEEPATTKLQVLPSNLVQEEYQKLTEEEGALVYDLYRIADVVKSGNVLEFLITNEFADLKDDLTRLSTTTSLEDRMTYEELAQLAFSYMIGSEGTMISAKDEAAYTSLELNQTYDITAGLYLMVTRGSIENSSVVKSVAMEEHGIYTDEMASYSLLGTTYFTVSPQIICAPTKISESGEILTDTLQEGNWSYEQTIYLKMKEDPAVGAVQIEKELVGYYQDAQNATFVFQVDVYFPTKDVLYSSEVYSLQFTSPGTKQLLVEGIPLGSTVKVSEIYSGLNYTASVAKDQTIDLEIVDNENIPVAYFTNTYNHKTAGGGGVTNHFAYGITEGIGSWSWEMLDDNLNSVNGIPRRLLQMILQGMQQVQH